MVASYFGVKRKDLPSGKRFALLIFLGGLLGLLVLPIALLEVLF